jgi:HlyD family secretion protein
MTCRVEIGVGSSSALPAVPIQAVLNEQVADSRDRAKSANYVFVVRQGKAKKTAVELGQADDASQEIIGGIAVGQSIVIGPARVLRELHDGDLVTPMKADVKVAEAGR